MEWSRLAFRGVALAASLACAPLRPVTAASAPVIGDSTAIRPASVPASGRQEALLSIGKFGRYAVVARSAQDVGLQIVDRMAGPGGICGGAGEDGRCDRFLDRGMYKLVTFGPERGHGEVSLQAHPFLERNPFPPPVIAELREIRDMLGDFEQRSYTLAIPERRTVILEATGRNLTDLRLWRNGDWLVDAAPRTETIAPRAGRSLTHCLLWADLEPGVYVLTAYGGPAQPWGEETGGHPFSVRWGIPRLAEAGRERRVAGASGLDLWLVPARTNLVRLELPEAAPARLRVESFDPDRPFTGTERSVDISKQTMPPVAEITLPDAPAPSSMRLITVRLEAGQPYVLQHFREEEVYEIRSEGEHRLSTLRTGDPADNVEPTVIVVEQAESPTEGPAIPYAAGVVEVGSAGAWARRFNLLGTVTVFLHLAEPGKVRIETSGTQARFRIEPFFVVPPREYRQPPLQPSGSTWDLPAGYFVLTIEPDTKGVLDVALAPAGLWDSMRSLLQRLSGSSEAAVRPSVVFPALRLRADRIYRAFYNRVPETRLGFVLRRLPLDLTEALPVMQGAGEVVQVPFVAVGSARLRAVAENGALLPISIDGLPGTIAPEVAAGRHSATVLAGDTLVSYSLSAEPSVPASASAGAPSSPAAPATPSFPVLSEDARVFFDLARGATATFQVRAGEPGLYRLESGGLLATSGSLRTRTVVPLDREAENGVGRNFLIQQYLREGEYQITVGAQGRSEGHLSLMLARTPLADAGGLRPGQVGRATIRAGEGAVYQLSIPDSGRYRIRSFGTAGPFRCRLEDSEGWPIERPGIAADLTRDLRPGTYRLVLLPGAVDARAVTRLDSLGGPPRFEGHGPHLLPLGVAVPHLWLEPAEGAARAPDLWQISLPAPCDLRIELTGEMEGSLTRDGAEVAFVPPGRPWSGPLEAGGYLLRAVCSRRNNRAPYTVRAEPAQLVAGLARSVEAPASLEVSVGADGLFEIESKATSDVRASLYKDGRLVQQDDDRPDDWNFLISAPLEPGIYRLRIEPVDAVRAEVEVSMRMPEDSLAAPLPLPGERTVRPGESVLLVPLEIPDSVGDLLAVGVSAGEAVGCAIEREDAVDPGGTRAGWSVVGAASGREGRVALPLPPVAARYRLRIWSLDRRGGEVRITAARASAPRFSESALARGVKLAAIAGILPQIAVAKVELDRPGLLRLQTPPETLFWSGITARACAAAEESLLAAPGTAIWLAAASETTVRAKRERLAPGESVTFALPRSGAAVCDLDVPRDDAVLAVSATALSGQPGVRIGSPDVPATLDPSALDMAVGARSALAVSLAAGKRAAAIWPAGGMNPSGKVRLALVSPPVSRETALAGFSGQGSVDGGRARGISLPPGPKHVRLSLADGVAALLAAEDGLRGLHWAGGAAFEESFETDAETMTVLNLGARSGRWAIDLLPLPPGAVAARIAPGRPYESRQESAAILRLPVSLPDDSAGYSLHVRTDLLPYGEAKAEAGPVWLGRDGSVGRGTDLVVAGGGVLLVPCRPGLSLAWVDRAGDEASGLWRDLGDGGASPGSAIVPPALVPLRGGAQALRLEVPGPGMIHLRVSGPAVSRVRMADRPVERSLHPSAVALDLYTRGGAAEIDLRGLAGAPLSGEAELTLAEVTPIGEGLGPEVLLPAGAVRVFAFRTERDGPVGIGARASSDRVTGTLLDAMGHPLGSGLVQMPTLPAGDYLLMLRAPADGPPITVRPALAGITPPATGPPEEVIRGYLAAP